MTATDHLELVNESRIQGFLSCTGRAIRPINEVAAEIAITDIPVIIFGESGTGKDAYARLMHALSPQSQAPFHKFNCAVLDLAHLSEYLRPLQGAMPGTLYLDNVHELDLAAQRMLLSLLPEELDTAQRDRLATRLVSSTPIDLESEANAGRFRKELYFRINGACLRLPPLRERLDDLACLLQFFLEKYAKALGKRIPTVAPELLTSLHRHRWPGNVRELENLARRMVVLGDCQVAIKEFESPRDIRPAAAFVSSKMVPLKVAARAASEKAERELILQALERTHWNRKRAARDLQISYKSLLYKIKQIGVSDQEGNS